MAGAVGFVRQGLRTAQASSAGDKMWGGMRTAMSGLMNVPQATMARAMMKGAKDGGPKPTLEVNLGFTGKTLSEFSLESVKKYAPDETTQAVLEAAGVELEGKTTSTLVGG